MIRGALEGVSVLIVKTAEEAEGRNLCERIHEGRPVTGDDIEIAVAGLDKRREKAGSVYPLAFCKDRLRIIETIDAEIKSLDPAVLGGLHEINHPDSFFGNEVQ